MSLYAHSIASPLTTELREDRSRRSASKIERWCPTAREQAALPPGCSHCKTLQVAACGTTLQDKYKKKIRGSHCDSAAVVCPSATVFTRVRYTMDAATSSPAHGAHRATPVSRRCVLATWKTTAHRRGMEPVCSKSLGVLLQAALAFFRARLHRSMWAILRTRILPVCRTTKLPRRSRHCPMDRKCVGSV